MLPPSSSTSSSEPPSTAPAAPRVKIGRAALWFVLFLALFEVGTWALFTKTRLANGKLRQFLWYGTSYEAKLRELVDTPNLPITSVLNAGWLGDGRLREQPLDVDVVVYGMSFSGNLAAAMRELRPALRERLALGPGAPLSHSYAMYQVDRKTGRKARFAVIGVTSIAVQEVVLMNRGTLFSDGSFPYFFPRFKVVDGNVVRVADSLINSAAELRSAFHDNPDLWRRQLEVLAANDEAYHRFFFAADPLDDSVLGRFVRRGLSKHAQLAHTSDILGPNGYNLAREAPQLFRALLRQMVRELRQENIVPIVALFSLQGNGDYLHALVDDILREDAIPFVDTYDDCKSDDRANYQPDLHFVHACDLAFAKRALQIMDATPAAAGARGR